MTHCTLTGSITEPNAIMVHISMSMAEIAALNTILQHGIARANPLTDYESLVLTKEFCLKLSQAAAQYRKISKTVIPRTPE